MSALYIAGEHCGVCGAAARPVGGWTVTVETLPTAQAAADCAARWIAHEARSAIAARGRFVIGFSGGSTPALMLRALAAQDVAWKAVEIVQIDERAAPTGDAARNLTGLIESFRGVPQAIAKIHAMPVEVLPADAAAARYAKTLREIGGVPPVLDVAHLGLGADGHTASLPPGDPVLDVSDVDVAWSAEYMGRRRMTLTYPLLNRARRVLWLVTGRDKAVALERLLRADAAIPAGRIQQDAAHLVADLAAAGG